ncbi:MAG: ABC transporter ATP-binding protein [Devosiaceae bacterium]|nr:ABC transporter ATP-binding protein [Devosiaceae bacterium]
MNNEQGLRLELEGIVKAFPGVLANDDISFSIKKGEIHALLGENGAGKSTLVKMIYGIMKPDEGTISWNGKPMNIANPKAARALGIGMVFQHFSLFEAMNVLENIALGMDEKMSKKALEEKVVNIMQKYGLSLDPKRVVSTLGVGERQRIEIVRALLLNPKLLIMDEPTSVLTPQEVAQLFNVLRQLSSDGCSILYISHKLDEIKELCDSATILRGGKVVATCDPKKETAKTMAAMMIGTSLQAINKVKSKDFSEIGFSVNNLSLKGAGDFGVSLKDISFDVYRGEILGIAGVAGNGQNELQLVLSGEILLKDKAKISMNNIEIGNMSAKERRKHGLCAVPEERHGHAAVPEFSLNDNAILTARNRQNMVRAGMINAKSAKQFTTKIIDEFNVMTTGHGASASSLSGGNLQKFIMGREILQVPDVLVVSQPTWGVDAGAASAIHQALIDLAKGGAAIVIISQDLDELLELCDSLAIINEGTLSQKQKVGVMSIEEIGLLMGGVHGENSSVSSSQKKVMAQ